MTVTSIILAAGEGKRLGNLTKKNPKMSCTNFWKVIIRKKFRNI